MKKRRLLAALLAGAMALSLTACGNTQDEPVSAGEDTAAENTAGGQSYTIDIRIGSTWRSTMRPRAFRTS